MADVIKNEIITLVDKELKAANEKFGINHSNHESFAVMKEEIDEAHEALAKVDYHQSCIWNATKSNTTTPPPHQKAGHSFAGAVFDAET